MAVPRPPLAPPTTPRRATAVLAAVVLGAGVLLATPPTALAAPVSTAALGAAGHAQLVGLDTTVLGAASVAGAAIGTADATATGAPVGSTATAANLGATVAGLPVTVQRSTRTAPPDDPATTSKDLAAVTVPLLVSTGVLSTTVQARSAAAGTCLAATTPISASTVSTTGLTVAPGLGGLSSAVRTGVLSAGTSTALVSTGGPGDARAVRTTSQATVGTVDVLGTAVTVTVTGNPTLTATATGTTATSGATLTGVDASTVTITAGGTTVPLGSDGKATIPVDLTNGLGTGVKGSVVVTLGSLGGVTNTGTAVTASASAVVLDVTAALYTAGLKTADLATVHLDVAPLQVQASAPADGVQCAPAAADTPVITSPADGALLATATPVLRGTGTPGATVTVTERGTTVCTATVGAGGTWTCTPTTLSQGAHTITATQLLPGGAPSPAATAVGFTVDSVAPAAPTVLSPDAGAQITDTTPTISGTGEPGATLTVSEGAQALCTTTVTTAGTWSCDATVLTAGSHTVTAVQVDAAGNASTPATRTFSVVAPAAGAPVITAPTSGALVNRGTVTVSGSGTAGAALTVSEGATTVCTTTVLGDGSWSCDAALAEGTHTLTATQVPSGGSESPASAPVVVTVDTTADAAPAITAPTTGALLGTGSPVVSGTGAAGSLVTVTATGPAGTPARTACTATVDGTGAWSCTVTPALADGTYTLGATQTDAAGNTSAASPTVQVTVDTTADAAPVITAPTSGTVTNAVTVPVSGTGVAGSVVTVRDTTDPGAPTVVCTATVTGTASWTCDATALAEGTHTLVATQTDPAGNTSPASAAVAVQVDRTAPGAPVITAPVDGDSSAQAPSSVTGTGNPGDAVAVTVDGTVVCTVTVGTSGAWTCPITPLAIGSHTITATSTDPAGNTGPATAPVRVTVLAPAAAAPVITSPADGTVTAATTPTVTGTGVGGATVTLRDGSTVLCTAVVTGTTWSCVSATLAQGLHVLSATQVVPGSDTSPTSTTVSLTVDTTAPAAPVITTPAAGSETTSTTPVIAGTAEPGTTLTVTEGARALCTVTVADDGSWRCTSAALTLGAHQVSAVAQDAAGNVSTAATQSFSVVQTVSATPTINPFPAATTRDTTPTVTGTGTAGATITVAEQGTTGTVCTTTVLTDGTWSCDATAALPEGTHAFTATQTVPGQAASAPVGPVSVIVDTTADPAPAVVAPAAGAVVRDTTPTISGTGVAGSTVTVTRPDGAGGSVVLCTPVVGSSGAWTCVPTTALPQGAVTVTATQADPAGNVSPASAPRSFTVDTVAPAAPVLTSPAQGSTVATGLVTFTGTGEPGDTVTVRENGAVLCTATVDQGGAWSCTETTASTVGPHTVSVTQTDAAGNTGPSTTSTFATQLGGTRFRAVTPRRVVDTRPSYGVRGGTTGPVPADHSFTVSAQSLGVAPGTASAVVLNLTVTEPDAAGYLRALPSGAAPTTGSGLNYGRGQTLAATLIVPVGADGGITIYTSARTQVVADLFGFFSTVEVLPDNGLFHAVDPARLLDTRLAGQRPLGNEATTALQVDGRGGVPATGVAAVVVNLTSTQSTRNSYLAAYASGQPVSPTSNVNFVAGATVANRAVVPVGPDGKITIYNSAGSSEVIVDVVGWFSALGSGDTTGAQFVAVAPTRTVDSRTGQGTGAIGRDGTNVVRLSGTSLVPLDGTVAVAATLTAVAPLSAGYLSAYPAGTPLPGTSDVNFLRSVTVANLALAKPSSTGLVALHSSATRVDVLVDVTGYFTTAPPTYAG